MFHEQVNAYESMIKFCCDHFKKSIGKHCCWMNRQDMGAEGAILSPDFTCQTFTSVRKLFVDLGWFAVSIDGINTITISLTVL